MQEQEKKHMIKRVINVKPTIDNKPPQNFSHINSKYTRPLKQREKEIDQHNKMFLNKMVSIMNRKLEEGSNASTLSTSMNSLNYNYRKK